MRYLSLLVLLSSNAFTSGQTGTEIGRDSGPTIGNVEQDTNSRRRNIFLPPPDRLSPTRKPILANYGNPTSVKDLSTPSSLRFTPTSSTANPMSDDYLYYEYYDYYYDDNNSTQRNELHADDLKETEKRPELPPSVSAKLKKEPQQPSKYDPSSFRYTTPISDRVVKSSPLTTETKGVSTAAPELRFRFTIAEKPDRPKRLPAATHNRHRETKLNLSDLLAQLRSSAQSSSSSSNDLDTFRKGRILNKTNLSISQRQPMQQRGPIEVAVSYTTDSSFLAHSLDERQPLLSNDTDQVDGNNILENSKLVQPETTKTIDANFTNKVSVARMEGKRVLDEKSPSANMPFMEDGKSDPIFDNEDQIISIQLSSDIESTSKNSTSTLFSEEVVNLKNTNETENDNTTFLNYNITDLAITNSENESDAALPNGLIVENIDISKFLPSGYSLGQDVSPKPVGIKPIKDLSAFLPAGYKLPAKTDAPLKTSLPVSTVTISNLLPINYKPVEENSTKEKIVPSGIVIKPVDISAFLPKGFKPSTSPVAEVNDSLKRNKPFDISSLLPKGFLEGKPTTVKPTERTLPNGLVFPKVPSRPPTSTTTEKVRYTIPPVKVKVINVFDRLKDLATTEFSAPKLVAKIKKEQEKAEEIKTTAEPTTTTTSTTTTTTTTTTVPPAPTTPGICGTKCRLAGSLRITNGAEWQPELANRDTYEFKILANEIQTELDSFYRSSSLAQWYEYVEIDSFIKGSVIVSYVLFLSEIRDDIDTTDLKGRLNDDMSRLAHSLGKFTLDPSATDFIVMGETPIYVTEEKQNFLIPEWLIAVIVIGLASFLFIVIFGVVALVSRARVRKRTNVPLKEEFLNNLNAMHAANGVDNYAMNGFYDMETIWNEKFPEKSRKPPSSRGKGYNPEYNVNIYDSWKTDYSDPYSCSVNNSKQRPQLDFDGKQFYDDDPYSF